MNKRQAKKAFKKKYGKNPSQLAKDFNSINWDKISEQLHDSLKYVCERINEFCYQINACICDISRLYRKYPDLMIQLSIATTEEERQEIVQKIQKRESKN